MILRRGTITETDRAVLSLKTQRRTLTGERKRVRAEALFLERTNSCHPSIIHVLFGNKNCHQFAAGSSSGSRTGCGTAAGGSWEKG